MWCWRRLLRVPWTARRSNQSILKEISPGCSLEGLILRPKLQSYGLDAKSWLIWKGLDAGKDWRREEKGMIEDEMVGWHHRLDGHEFGQTLGLGDGQGGLACFSSRGFKNSDTAEVLNWTDRHHTYIYAYREITYDKLLKNSFKSVCLVFMQDGWVISLFALDHSVGSYDAMRALMKIDQK